MTEYEGSKQPGKDASGIASGLVVDCVTGDGYD